MMEELSREIVAFCQPNPDTECQKTSLTKFIIECARQLERSQSADTILKATSSSRLPSHQQSAPQSAWNIFMFGSQFWRTSNPDSDVDIACFIRPSLPHHVRKSLLSALADIISLKDRDHEMSITRRLNVRYPILSIVHSETSIQLDVSIADRWCNPTRLRILHLLDSLETTHRFPFIRALIQWFKYWTKQRSIHNAFKGYLNSFGCTLMVLFFAQIHITECSQNELGNLVMEFFRFYAVHFDPKRHRVDINQRSLTLKQCRFDALEIVDPEHSTKNVASNVGRKQVDRIWSEIGNAFRVVSCEQMHGMSLFNVLVYGDTESVHKQMIRKKTMKLINGYRSRSDVNCRNRKELMPRESYFGPSTENGNDEKTVCDQHQNQDQEENQRQKHNMSFPADSESMNHSKQRMNGYLRGRTLEYDVHSNGDSVYTQRPQMVRKRRLSPPPRPRVFTENHNADNDRGRRRLSPPPTPPDCNQWETLD